jgi:hypothetical protein
LNQANGVERLAGFERRYAGAPDEFRDQLVRLAESENQ